MRREKIRHTRPMPRILGTALRRPPPCAISAWAPRRTCSGCASMNRVHWARVNTPLCRQTSAIHSARRPVQPKDPSACSRPRRWAITSSPP